MKRITVLVLLSSLLGIFFLVSGVGKALDIAQFAESIASYGFPGLRFISPLVIASEIGLGVGLLMQVQPRRLALLSIGLLSAFTLLFAYGYWYHGVTSCGCFGALEALQTPPWVSFLRNGLLLLAAIGLYRSAPASPVPSAVFPRLLVGSATASSLLLVSFLYVRHGTSLRTSVSAGQAVRASALAPYCRSAGDSTYVVFIFSPACSHCWSATPQVLNYQRSGLASKITAICPPVADSARQKYLAHFTPPFGIRTLIASELIKITRELPTTIVIRRDTVLAVFTGRLPSADSLRLAFKPSQHRSAYAASNPRGQ